MMHASSSRLINLLGALSIGAADRLHAAVASQEHVGSSAAAALTLILMHERLTIDGLARFLSLSHSGTSRLVERLRTLGYVHTGRGESDRRQSCLRLTPKGAEKARQILASREAALRDLILPLAGPERETLEALLDRMLRGLTRDAVQGARICRLCDTDACPPERCPVEQRITEIHGE